MVFEYYKIFIDLVFMVLVAFLIFSLSFFIVTKQYDEEKTSPYECGFDPFLDSRQFFEVRFYLVAILFLIFDLEITFLFPYSVSVFCLGYFGFFLFILFLSILTLGFVYEWSKGALDWE